ncbi:MAG: S9 family peptidase [Asgard group archaeon]|nr:S9 family peptidase [Asgard group archaeon]
MNKKNNIKKHKPKLMEYFLTSEPSGSLPNPDGSKVAYGELYVNLKENRYERHCYIYDVKLNTHFRLTQIPVASNIRWLDNNSLVILARDNNSQYQIFLYENLIGDGQQITFHPGGVRIFELFNNGFVFIANNPSKSKNDKKLANYTHIEEEESTTALYYIDLQKAKDYALKIDHTFDENNKPLLPVIEISKLLPSQLAINKVICHSETKTLYLQCQSKDDQQFSLERSFFKIELDSDKIIEEYLSSKDSDIITQYGKITSMALPKGTQIRDISSQGNKLLFAFPERDLKQYTLMTLWILDLNKAKNHLESQDLMKYANCISRNLDREFYGINWTDQGVLVTYFNESFGEFALLSETGEVTVLDKQGLSFCSSFVGVSDSGWISFQGASQTTIMDVYLAHVENKKIVDIKRITSWNEKYAHWDHGTVESIKWKSKDGTEIEGVLRKPSNFDPKKKYPLIFHIHGGPSTSSLNVLLHYDDKNFYPTIPFVNKDILILMPNYRGSLGKGQWFHELGVDNLGVGDMWDIESCIDHLLKQGFIDESRIGAMGWSQGGFISAFLGMHSDRFKVVSCGASVSSWYTFYISSDIRHSVNLSGNPTEEGMMEKYRKTAPISGIQNAKTPMLLQHGENDQRISVVSAYELYRSLKDKGIQTELFVYPGMGHGINKPREVYAANIQNYRWFMHHFFDEELDFTKGD